MATNARQNDYCKGAYRLPPDIHKQLHAAALSNKRSFNSELIARLQDSLVDQEIADADSGQDEPTASDRRQAIAYPLRLPPEVRSQVEASAKRTGRSLNAEIAAQLRGAPNVADLRDRFALEAMKLIGTLASQRLHDLPAGADAATGIAIEAYKLADAMLQAREGGAA